VSGSGPIFIDEYQHEPAVLAAVKAELNNDLRPGRFVLAGSTAQRPCPKSRSIWQDGSASSRSFRCPRVRSRVHERTFVETLMLGEPRSLVTNKRSETSRVEYARRITHRWHADRAREERAGATTVVRRVSVEAGP